MGEGVRGSNENRREGERERGEKGRTIEGSRIITRGREGPEASVDEPPCDTHDAFPHFPILHLQNLTSAKRGTPVSDFKGSHIFSCFFITLDSRRIRLKKSYFTIEHF